MVAHAHDTLKSIFSFADFRGRQDEIVLLAAPTAVVNGFLVRPIALCVGGGCLKIPTEAWMLASAAYFL